MIPGGALGGAPGGASGSWWPLVASVVPGGSWWVLVATGGSGGLLVAPGNPW